MENESMLRIYRTHIKEYFLRSLISRNFNPKLYVHSCSFFNWNIKGDYHKVKRVEKDDYEETLQKFVEFPSAGTVEHPLLIIVGGIGTGKSTTMKYVLEISKKCHKCTTDELCDKSKPLVIDIDLFEETSDPSDNVKDSDDKILDRIIDNFDEFWTIIAKKLDTYLTKLSRKEEVIEFIPWVNKIKGTPSALYRFYDDNKELYKEVVVHSPELIKIYYEIRSKLTLEDLCILKTFQIKYLRREFKNFCLFIEFDNIDSCSPILQRKALDFAIKACQTLNARAFIPMRPLTFSINTHAHNFSEVMDHETPDIFDVLERRATFMKDDPNVKRKPELIILQKHLCNLIDAIKKNPFRKDIFMKSAGISSRFGLRNFYNLCLSPLIITNPDGTNNIDSLDNNLFYQAFFCNEEHEDGTIDSNFLAESNFNNLIKVTIDGNKFKLSTIKFRILLYLFHSSNGVSLKILSGILQKFGYDDYEIVEAFNSLIKKRTPLIWSDTFETYDIYHLFENHTFYLSPIGRNYLTVLMRSPYYFRECIFAYNQNRIYDKIAWLNSCKDNLRKLEEMDLNEIMHFCDQTSPDYYKSLYDIDKAVGTFLWKSLQQPLSELGADVGFIVDYQHDSFIIKKLKDFFKEKNFFSSI